MPPREIQHFLSLIYICPIRSPSSRPRPPSLSMFAEFPLSRGNARLSSPRSLAPPLAVLPAESRILPSFRYLIYCYLAAPCPHPRPLALLSVFCGPNVRCLRLRLSPPADFQFASAHDQIHPSIHRKCILSFRPS